MKCFSVRPWLSVVVGGFAAMLAVAGVGAASAADGDSAKLPASGTIEKQSVVGRKIANFVLPDQRGGQVGLSDFDGKRSVVFFFMGTGCPISNLYLTELGSLQQRYEKQGLQVVGINSNAGTTPAEIRDHAAEYKVQLPVLLDADQRVANLLSANRTAEVFLLDDQHVVRYHGRVDDRFGYTYKNAKPSRHDLEEAVKEVLAGEKVTVAQTKPLGCLITRNKRIDGDSPVNYAKDVSRILQQRCQECHRPGMIGPFSLLTYEDAVKKSDMIEEVVLEGRMPPWHADPRYGHWSNKRQMPQQEIDALVAWIDGGKPLGNKDDLPAPVDYAEGWTISKPDIVFELPEEVTIPADGVVPYRYFKVPTNFKEDVWIQAAEARPGNRAVVHHIIVFSQGGKGGGSAHNHICGTAPGDPPTVLPPGVARRIPAGSQLLFQMHYTPTGKVEKDRSQVGFVLYKGERPPKGFAQTQPIMNRRFEIPAGDSNHQVESSYTFKKDVTLLTLMPHMHLRGKDFLYRITRPDGTSEVLLSVPRYDFNWQNTYSFATPLTLAAGTRIDCLAHFDNSPGNPANPDATKTVRWGDQTWEEMMIGWVSYMTEGPAAASNDEHADDENP